MYPKPCPQPVGLKKQEKRFFHWKGLSRNWYSQGSVKVRKWGRILEEKLKMEGCHVAPRKALVPVRLRVKMDGKDCTEGQ